MKKVLVILMALIMACFSISAFAVDYSDAEVKASIEFEGITDADLGGASEIIGDFDPHGTWQLTEGFASIVEGKHGNGLQLTPNYANPEGYISCVMRAKMPVIAQSEGWGTAWGLRFYIANNSWSDAYVTPMAFMNAEDGQLVIAPAAGAYTVEDGEYCEVELSTQADSVNASICIPSGFEGYVVLPFVYYNGDNDEYDCGWQCLPSWSTTENTDSANFADIAEFALDVRLYSFDTADTEGLILDCFEFIGNAGEEVLPPDGEEEQEPVETTEPNTTQDTENNDEITDAPDDAQQGFPVWIIIAAAAVVVVVVVVIVIVAASKKKKD